jgi:hypothetical protein
MRSLGNEDLLQCLEIMNVLSVLIRFQDGGGIVCCHLVCGFYKVSHVLFIRRFSFADSIILLLCKCLPFFPVFTMSVLSAVLYPY